MRFPARNHTDRPSGLEAEPLTHDGSNPVLKRRDQDWRKVRIWNYFGIATF